VYVEHFLAIEILKVVFDYITNICEPNNATEMSRVKAILQL